jgi:heparin binding hemagglutinin HbhA
MANTTTSNRRPAIDPTPLFAVVGATDLAVERVRTVVANVTATQAEAQKHAQKAISEFDPKAAAQEVPTRAVAVALETASKAEARYEEFAKRGKQLVERVRTQQSTQEFVHRTSGTISRTKGAVTTTRRAAEDTASALLTTLGVARREATGVVRTASESAEEAADTTERSAKKTTARARKNATATKAAAKGVRTSASKTATSASEAAKDAADKVGD